MKKVVVAGSRHYENYAQAKAFLQKFIKETDKASIVFLSGGCRGADLLGERFAQEKGLPVLRYEADWKRYKKAAGPKRNREMARDCDLLICFWDGKSRGTASMISYAKALKKEVHIKRI